GKGAAAAPGDVKRSDGAKSFGALPRRRVVQRTFSWFGRNQRLAKDFENLAQTPAPLRDPRLHTAGPQAARYGAGHAPNKNWVNIS
ncbi:MAG: hypothetical protein WA633_29555, partial [Stellaceae bacterium]